MGLSKNRGTVRGHRARLTRVDACGEPIFGDDSQAVTKSFASVAYTVNTVDTDGIDLRDADGKPSIREDAQSDFASFGIEAVFNKVDPEFFEIATKQRVIRDEAGVAIGFAINSKTDTKIEGFALEVWAGAPEGDCDPDSTEEYGYFLAPFVKGARLGDYTIENGAVTFSITGGTTRDGTGWGSGPYNVQRVAGVPAPLREPLDRDDHKLMIWVTVPPPDVFVGARPVLDRTKAALTALTMVEGASPSEAVFSFTGGAVGVPVWIDFGDGTWDYLDSGNVTASHTYASNGTFVARASSNGAWVTRSVEIPFP